MVYSYTTDKILGMWFCLQKASINVSLTYLRELENPELTKDDMPVVYTKTPLKLISDVSLHSKIFYLIVFRS